jgi:hypothetical protein
MKNTLISTGPFGRSTKYTKLTDLIGKTHLQVRTTTGSEIRQLLNRAVLVSYTSQSLTVTERLLNVSVLLPMIFAGEKQLRRLKAALNKLTSLKFRLERVN